MTYVNPTDQFRYEIETESHDQVSITDDGYALNWNKIIKQTHLER